MRVQEQVSCCSCMQVDAQAWNSHSCGIVQGLVSKPTVLVWAPDQQCNGRIAAGVQLEDVR